MYRRSSLSDHQRAHRHAVPPGSRVRFCCHVGVSELYSRVHLSRSSAVVSIGAATLADLYEPAQRGTMMGIYLWYVIATVSSATNLYTHHCLRSCSAPLLGPSLGPIIGGVLAQAFSWRATFWFLVIFTGLCIIPFVFFRDTFRRERSLTYQAALRKLRERENRKPDTAAANDTQRSSPTRSESPDDGTAEVKSQCSSVETKVDVDIEAHVPTLGDTSTSKEVRLSLMDVNPIRPMVNVLRCPNNVVIIIASGTLHVLSVRSTVAHPFLALLFAFEYSILYTASLTLADVYRYDALKIGLTLLSFGFGALS